MKKVQTLTCIMLTVILIGICMCTNVYAETQSLKFTVGADKTELQEGQEIIITLKLSEINMGEDGINTFQGKLVYDDAIFEEVKATNFSSQNNWSITYNDENTDKKGTFFAAIMTGAKTDQTIGTVKLKVKSKVKSTSTQIKFTELSSIGTDEVKLKDEIIQLKVTGTLIDEEKNPPKDNNDGGANNNNSNDKDTTTNTGKIPKTGIISYDIIIAISVLIIVAIFAYAKLKKIGKIK